MRPVINPIYLVYRINISCNKARSTTIEAWSKIGGNMVDLLSRIRLTRRKVAAAAVVSAIAPSAVCWDEAEAYSPCSSFVGYDIENVRNYSAATWGPPSCEESCAYIESPNGNYYNEYCCVCAPTPCECAPLYIQARVGVTNTGLCSRRCSEPSFLMERGATEHDDATGNSQWTEYQPQP